MKILFKSSTMPTNKEIYSTWLNIFALEYADLQVQYDGLEAICDDDFYCSDDSESEDSYNEAENRSRRSNVSDINSQDADIINDNDNNNDVHRGAEAVSSSFQNSKEPQPLAVLTSHNAKFSSTTRTHLMHGNNTHQFPRETMPGRTNPNFQQPIKAFSTQILEISENTTKCNNLNLQTRATVLTRPGETKLDIREAYRIIKADNISFITRFDAFLKSYNIIRSNETWTNGSLYFEQLVDKHHTSILANREPFTAPFSAQQYQQQQQPLPPQQHIGTAISPTSRVELRNRLVRITQQTSRRGAWGVNEDIRPKIPGGGFHEEGSGLSERRWLYRETLGSQGNILANQMY